jgi:AcrR family transcriptional regulator
VQTLVPTSAERGRTTRELLLNAAAELIPECGWGAVTTRMVAQRAGVNPGLVHYHFSSVPDLLTEAVLRVARLAVGEPTRMLAEAPDVGTGVDLLLGALDPYTGTDPASLLLTEGLLASTRHEPLRAELAVLLGDFRERVADWLRALGHPDADQSAVLLAAVIDGLLLHRAIDPALDLAAMAGVLRRMLTGGAAGAA